MRIALLLAGALVISLASFQATSKGAEDPSLQALVDQLKEITVKSRSERAADRWLQNALDDLVARYDWPWSKELLNEEFSDGDYSKNPKWQVLSGQFWIDGRLGLRSRSVSRPERNETIEKDLGQALLGAFMDQAFRNSHQDSQKQDPGNQRYETAEIRVPLQIPTVYSVQVDFSVHNAPSESGQIEFGIYQGSEGGSGYSLILYTGGRSSVELISQVGGRTAVIESAEIQRVSDGHAHTLEWRSGPDGRIDILLDERQLVQARDRSFRYPFREFRLTNRKGDFAVAAVRVHGED